MVSLAEQARARPAAKAPRLPSLTGMRFIAAAMVFCFHGSLAHLFSSTRAQSSWYAIFKQSDWSGVSFFFVLSGFVLTWSMRATDSAPVFWRRRFFKIYPNQIVTFIGSVLLISWVSKMAIGAWPAVLNLVLLQSWFPNLNIAYSVNVVAWSLSCEVFFYFAFPFLMRFIRRIRPERLWLWVGVNLAAIIAIPFVASALPPGPMVPQAGLPARQLWLLSLFPPVRLLDFVFGILLARVVLTGRKVPVSLGGAVALCVAAYALAPLFPMAFRVSAVLAAPLGLVVAAGAVADVKKQRTLASGKVMVWLGDVSYAFYLCHYMIMVYVLTWLGSATGWSTPVGIAVLVMLFAISLVAAWLLYSLVERPMMRRFATSRRRTRLAGGLAAPPVTAAAAVAGGQSVPPAHAGAEPVAAALAGVAATDAAEPAIE